MRERLNVKSKTTIPLVPLYIAQRARRNKWDARFLELAKNISLWSKDQSTQVGAVIVRPDLSIASTGYNGFPREVDDDAEDRHERPRKYLFAEHAERNAIYQAAKHGVDLNDSTIYIQCSRPLFSCADCARAIIQVGIARVVGHDPDLEDPTWGESNAAALTMFKEAGIQVS
jgi:dCMP deaminase